MYNKEFKILLKMNKLMNILRNQNLQDQNNQNNNKFNQNKINLL